MNTEKSLRLISITSIKPGEAIIRIAIPKHIYDQDIVFIKEGTLLNCLGLQGIIASVVFERHNADRDLDDLTENNSVHAYIYMNTTDETLSPDEITSFYNATYPNYAYIFSFEGEEGEEGLSAIIYDTSLIKESFKIINADSVLEVKKSMQETATYTNVLVEAHELIHGNRRESYGTPRQNMQTTADLWSPILGIKVTPEQVALCMLQLKIARELYKPSDDNVKDMAGYTGVYKMTLSGAK